MRKPLPMLAILLKEIAGNGRVSLQERLLTHRPEKHVCMCRVRTSSWPPGIDPWVSVGHDLANGFSLLAARLGKLLVDPRRAAYIFLDRK